MKLYQSSLPLAMAQAVCGDVAGWALTYGPAGEFGDNGLNYKKQIRRIHNVASADRRQADKYVWSISDSGLALGGPRSPLYLNNTSIRANPAPSSHIPDLLFNKSFAVLLLWIYRFELCDVMPK